MAGSRPVDHWERQRKLESDGGSQKVQESMGNNFFSSHLTWRCVVRIYRKLLHTRNSRSQAKPVSQVEKVREPENPAETMDHRGRRWSPGGSWTAGLQPVDHWKRRRKLAPTAKSAGGGQNVQDFCRMARNLINRQSDFFCFSPPLCGVASPGFISLCQAPQQE
jgi:hypothetical protein